MRVKARYKGQKMKELVIEKVSPHERTRKKRKVLRGDRNTDK